MSTLFRPESLAAKSHAWLGKPVILPSLSLRIVARVSILFVVLAVLFVTFGSYTRRIEVQGVVMPVEGLARMAAPQAGWVRDITVTEGDRVARGDVLYTIDVDVTTSLGNTQDTIAAILQDKRAELQAALTRQAEIDAAEKRDLEQQIEVLAAQLPLVNEQIALAEETTERLRGFVERQQAMLEQGIAVSAEVESRLQAYDAERARLPLLARERIQLDGQLSDLRARLARFDLGAADRLARLRQELLDIEQQISEGETRREISITAPRDGIVTGISTLAGQTVAAGTPLLTIVPAEQPLVVQILAPSNAIGFVRDGAEVRLRYEAFPYQKFGQYSAGITEISRATLSPEDIARIGGMLAQAADPSSFYRITVEPELPFVRAYGQQEPLQAGMRVDAHLLVDRRPLYQWILEPLYGLRGGLISET